MMVYDCHHDGSAQDDFLMDGQPWFLDVDSCV